MKVNLIPADTSTDILVRQIAVFRKMTTQQRAEMTFQLSKNLRRILIEGIRHRNPEYSRKQVRCEILRLTLPHNLYKQVLKEAGDRM